MQATRRHRIRSVLVANRGEIACRIMRTARDMGIATVAVFSDDDRDAPHVRLADTAVRLGGGSARETYLNQELVVAAAAAAGVDAVHPGYGFLSEEHTFARRCEDAGLVFVGPSSTVIRQMALKDAAKEIAARAGVPVLRGAAVTGEDEAAWVAGAGKVGYPVIVKAVAGGGGRGMHVAEDDAGLVRAIRVARREAGNLFGSDEVIVERYLPAPRHIEVQVVGDSHGAAVHVFERECSIQRRHQKVIEEAPSPAVDGDLRGRMGAAAVGLVKALGYVGVGTAEFLLDDGGDEPEFFFLEMNTRIQVEHPVTEEISGLDLVRLQFEVARGGHLPFGQEDLRITGHAIEARLYAEDPAEGFSPRPGELLDYRHEDLAGVRYEDGVVGPSTVSPRYDPMISKIVARGASRDEAVGRLAGALRRLTVHGIPTNRDFLLAVLDTDAFLAGETRTDFLDRHPQVLAAERGAGPDEHLAALVAVTALGNAARSAVPFALPGFRILPKVWSPALRLERVHDPADAVELTYRFEGELHRPRLHLRVDGREQQFDLRDVADAAVRVARDGLEVRCEVARYDDGSIWVNDARAQSGWRPRGAAGVAGGEAATGEVASALPGTVVAVRVAPGQQVERGEELLVVEAMKMEHPVVAPRPGYVRLAVGVGEFIQAGVVLAEVLEEPA